MLPGALSETAAALNWRGVKYYVSVFERENVRSECAPFIYRALNGTVVLACQVLLLCRLATMRERAFE